MQIRDAATVVLQRDDGRVLMGQRGHGAVFMPGKFVFPGGAVDAADFEATPIGTLAPACLRRLCIDADRAVAGALAVAALRELREETGLVLRDAAALSFVFRAVTPPGRPRRFDARFFLADAAHLETDPDDFSRAEDELSHLQWLSPLEARAFDLPFVTRIVLAEIEATSGAPDHVPFYDHRGSVGRVRALT
ncbi:NUDIX hydrolase [Celeribacter arenosi]